MRSLQRILLSLVLICTCYIAYHQKIDLINTQADIKNLRADMYESDSENFKHIQKTIVSINTLACDVYSFHQELNLSVLDSCGLITNGGNFGSCVAIGPNLILTAGHCIDILDTWIEIGGIRFEIKSKWRSSQYDVGFVVVDAILPYLDIGDNPGVLDEIYLIGSPEKMAFVNKISKGIVCKINLNYSDPVVNWDGDFLCDAMAWGGNSGGPVLTIDGKIVGIDVGLFLDIDNFSVCVPASQIKEALEQYHATFEGKS